MRKTATKRAAEPAATEVVEKAKPYEQPPPITKRPKTKKSGGGSGQNDGKSSSNNGGGGDSGAASSDANSAGGGDKGASGGRSGDGESEKRTTPDTGGTHGGGGGEEQAARASADTARAGGGGGEEQAARASADTARATSGAAGTSPSAPKAKKTLKTIKHTPPSGNFEFPPFTMPAQHFEGPTEFASAMASPLKGQKLDPYNIYPVDPANTTLTFLHQHPHWPGEFNDCAHAFFFVFFFSHKHNTYITPTGAPPLPLCFSHGKDAGVHGCVLLRGRERRDCRVLHLLLALPQGIWHAL
jgi:hypothetical protein